MSDKPTFSLFSPDEVEQLNRLQDARPKAKDKRSIEAEVEKCKANFPYFVKKYVKIYDNDEKTWIPFELWESQQPVVTLLIEEQNVILLKARQLGMTWLALAYALWRMLFHPIEEWLMFSQSEDEALALLSDQRMKGMHKQLPDWLQQPVVGDSKSEFRLGNGSGAKALPASRGGDSRTLTGVIIDEADLIDNVNDLVNRARPTLGTKGKMFLISRIVKAKPNSFFKRTYLKARKGGSEWKCHFLPWYAHPKRTPEWYKRLCDEAMETEGTLDSVWEQYPATDDEALAERSLDKRFNGEWISRLFHELQPLQFLDNAPILTGLRVFIPPEPGREYAIGADPAEGNPSSDDSVACVREAFSGEQVAVLAGKLEPAVFAESVAELANYYNGAGILVERNNHGHTMLLRLRQISATIRLGADGKDGWHTNERSKVAIYDREVEQMSQILKDSRISGEPVKAIIHDMTTSAQLRSIDVNTLKAPDNYHDDYAVAFVLAGMAAAQGGDISMEFVKHAGLYSPLPQQPDKLRDALLQARRAATVQQVTPDDTAPVVRRASDADDLALRVRFRGRR